MSAAGAGRPAKRARLEADKRRDALAEVEDKYADIDFTRFQKVVDIDTGADGSMASQAQGKSRPRWRAGGTGGPTAGAPAPP